MSRKARYIKNLTEIDKRSLNNGYKSEKSFLFRRKCHCILLSYEKHTVKELSSFFKVTQHTVYEWLNLWDHSGIKALELKPGRGRKPKLDSQNAEQVDKIKSYIENDPKKLKGIISKIEKDLDIYLSKKTLKRFLKSLNSNGNAFDAE